MFSPFSMCSAATVLLVILVRCEQFVDRSRLNVPPLSGQILSLGWRSVHLHWRAPARATVNACCAALRAESIPPPFA
jgi:hypothetical protein